MKYFNQRENTLAMEWINQGKNVYVWETILRKWKSIITIMLWFLSRCPSQFQAVIWWKWVFQRWQNPQFMIDSCSSAGIMGMRATPSLGQVAVYSLRDRKTLIPFPFGHVALAIFHCHEIPLCHPAFEQASASCG